MTATQARDPVTEPQAQPGDAGRWLLVTLIRFAKEFLTIAAKAGFDEARHRERCPKCGWRG